MWAEELQELFRVNSRPGPVEWVEGNLVVPRKMSPTGAGRVNLEGKPFIRWILDCWDPASGVGTCAVAGAAQLFKTFTAVLGMAYRMRFEPLPMLVVGPSRDWVKREIAERRLHPLILENPGLAEMMPADMDRFRLLHMEMRGGDVVLCGANSDTELAGGTFGIVVIEEAAKITQQSSEEAAEAHPIYLAMERTNAFGSAGFRWLSSTPNTPEHVFWKEVEAGDFTLPAVRCPHCGEWFNLEVEEDKAKGYRSLICDEGCRGADGVWDKERVLESARYVCPRNGCVIGNEFKRGMLRGMEPDRKHGGAPRDRRSFRVNYLHDPGLSWGEGLWKFFEAQGDLFGMQNFRNSKLALPWEELECNVKEEVVNKRRNGCYRRGVVPFEPMALVVTADPGERETHWEVCALMASGELWVVDWGTELSWEQMLRPEWVEGRRYALAGTGEVLRPRVGLIDSGTWTHRIYQFCRESRGGPIVWMPAKGGGAQHGTWAMTTPPEDPRMKLVVYTDRQAKDELYLRRIAMGGAPGVWFPGDADAGLLNGHTGQQLVKTAEGKKWKRIPWDHYGDCTKLGMILGWVLGERR